MNSIICLTHFRISTYRVVFNNTIGGIVNTVMHELGKLFSTVRTNVRLKTYPDGTLSRSTGHNVGLLHTGRNGDQYADLTSIMGYVRSWKLELYNYFSSFAQNMFQFHFSQTVQGKFRQFGPPKCFSGYNFWYLGWYASRQLDVIPTNQSQIVQLATFVDFQNTTSSQPVVVKVGSFYMVYNRAKGCNRGTEMSQDKVTVVLGDSKSPSSLVASLGNTAGSTTFVAPNFNGSSQTLTIVVCQVVNGGAADYVTVSISLGQPLCVTSRLRGKQ